MENSSTIQVTESAAKRIAFLLEREEMPDAKLRITVDGGGCSGFQYKFDFDNKQNDDDILVDNIVLIDQISLGFMDGAVLNYAETLGAAHFEIKNPNATANCGCGNSFSV